ncbi:DUF4845 domain-containing protein [Nitrococcus mobilis]|nr:DUF4845 domain-containing protein [Nitrococcus mobilis]
MSRFGHQGGMTLVSWLVALCLIGTFILMAIRLAPVYIEAYEVGSILQSMAGDSGLRNSTRGKVWETFKKRLDINNINYIVKSDVAMNEVADGLQLIVAYQARVHLLGNLDAVASFRKEAMIRK